MTIQNKEWYFSQVMRLSLSGFSQARIAEELRISEGTVNEILQLLIRSDDTLRLQHEIAIVSKKTGVSIKQMASNMAFANAIKAMGFEQDKIETVLRAINSACIHDASLGPNSFGTLFLQFCELSEKNHVSPVDLYDQLRSKYDELNKLNQQIEERRMKLSQLEENLKTELERYKITAQTLQDFVTLKEDFEETGIDFDKREEFCNTLFNLYEMDNDADKILDEIKHTRPLKLRKRSLEEECDKMQQILENYRKKEDEEKRKFGFYYPAADTINTILQRGFSPHSVIKIFDIISKHQDLSVDEFAEGIDTYGSIQGSIHKKFCDYIRICTAIQGLTAHGAVTNQNQQVQ